MSDEHRLRGHQRRLTDVDEQLPLIALAQVLGAEVEIRGRVEAHGRALGDPVVLPATLAMTAQGTPVLQLDPLPMVRRLEERHG